MRHERIGLYAAWAFAVSLLAFALLVVAPGRGAGWLVDDGLFLANAWNAAHGFGLDGMLPQEPVYLANSLLIKLGATEILHQRYAFYLITSLGAAIFFSGLDPKGMRSWKVPLAIAGTLCIAFSAILLMYVFFLYAAGCYFHSTKATGESKRFLLVMSGALFALAAFMHISIAIAMAVCVVFICVADATVRASRILTAFILVSGVLWIRYLQALGLDRFMATPAGHNASVLHLLGNVAKIVWFFVFSALLYIGAVYALRKKGSNRYAIAQYGLSILITVVYSAKFFGAQMLSLFPDVFVEIGFGRYSVQRLVDAIRLVVDAPGAIFWLLAFVIYRWMAEHLPLSALLRARMPSPFLQTVIGMSVQAKIAINADFEHLRMAVAILGLFLIAAGYAAGSASSFAICLAAFSSPALGVLLIDLHGGTEVQLANAFRKVYAGLTMVWFAMFLLFMARMNLPTFEPILSGQRVTLETSPLKGIQESREYRHAVDSLLAAYAAGDCDGKTFITLDYVPTVYLVLQHPVPVAYGVVRPGVYFPADKLRESLAAGAWCVLDVTTEETQSMIDAKRSGDWREGVRGMVQAKSRGSIELPSPSRDVSRMRLYY